MCSKGNFIDAIFSLHFVFPDFDLLLLADHQNLIFRTF